MQLSGTCAAMFTSGHAAFLAILILSEITEVAAMRVRLDSLVGDKQSNVNSRQNMYFSTGINHKVIIYVCGVFNKCSRI